MKFQYNTPKNDNLRHKEKTGEPQPPKLNIQYQKMPPAERDKYSLKELLNPTTLNQRLKAKRPPLQQLKKIIVLIMNFLVNLKDQSEEFYKAVKEVECFIQNVFYEHKELFQKKALVNHYFHFLIKSISELQNKESKLELYFPIQTKKAEKNDLSSTINKESILQTEQEIGKLRQKKIEFPDYENICCAKYHLRNHPIIEQTSIKNIIYLSPRQLFDDLQCRKIVCGALNSRNGACILIGEKNENNIIDGFKMNKKTMEYIKQLFVKVQRNIHPYFRYKLTFLPVHDDYTLENSQPGLFLPRVVLKSFPPHYAAIPRKGFDSLNQFYILKENNKYKKVELEAIYKFIQNKCKKRKKNQPKKKAESNLHYAYQQNSCEKRLQGKLVDIGCPMIHYEFEKSTDFPIFSYRHQSMIIAGSSKKQHFVEKLFDAMNQKMLIFTTIKPFKKIMESSGRLIWFISHEDKFQTIEDEKKKIDKNNNQFSFFSVNCHIQIDMKEKTEMRLAQLRQKIGVEYGTIFKEERRKVPSKNPDEEPLKKIFLSFENMQQAIFAFIFLDSLGLRTLFAKESQKIGQLF